MTITLTLHQIVIIIIFIGVFTYFWLPVKNTNDQYLILLQKYNKLLESKNKYKNLARTTDTIGKKISANGGSINPEMIDDEMDGQVNEMFFP